MSKRDQKGMQAHSSLQKLPQHEGARSKRVAVLVCHGMGQQAPFDTLVSIAEQLSIGTGLRATVRQVRFVDEHEPEVPAKRNLWLTRAEMNVAAKKGKSGPKREVHVYEAYWAPMTENSISLWEVVKFMVRAGWNDLGRSKTFERWLFNGPQSFRATASMRLGLNLALLLVGALTVLNVIVLLLLARYLLHGIGGMATPNLLLATLSWDLIWLLLTGGATGLSLWCSSHLGKAQNSRHHWVHTLSTGLLMLMALMLVLTALLAGYHYLNLHDFELNNRSSLGRAYPDGVLLLPQYEQLHHWLSRGFNAGLAPVLVFLHLSTTVLETCRPFVALTLRTIEWGVVLGLTYAARTFFVRYLGDVAIYIDANRVDKFQKLRQQIRHQAHRTACALYSARESSQTLDQFCYDRVVIVGHSLGSAVAYDALNASLLLDEALGGKLRVAQRTARLLTFGSPLDKMTYVFHNQVPPGNTLRAMQGASRQPLIRDQRVREQVSWVNIYSPFDPVSSALHYFDRAREQDQPGFKRVVNKRDPQAVTPLVAHSQYWENDLLTNELRAAIFC
ncbi:hypothetical protein [Hymenobacter sp. B81]|uniref:hypothetical protein n=1 Tax=Hymenobacter sp. B81 TaxID=3344878 RepID=UPI0037DC5774